MTSTSLTERYIYAATRSVPEKSRDDLRAELEASIADAIDARIEGGQHSAAAERDVLTEMGDPDRLAADYSDRPAYLIGPRYYFEWLRLVKLLFAIILPIATAGVALGQLIAGSANGGVVVGDVIGSVVVAAMTISLHLAFWPTLIFAILERNHGSSLLETNAATAAGPWAPWTLERLPEIRPKGLGVADLVATLVYVALLIGALLWDQLVGFVFVDGAGVPIIDPALWSLWLPVLLIALIGEAVFAIVLHRVGRWTAGLAAANAVLALVFALPIIWLVTQNALFNPAFFPAVAGADAAEASQIVGIVVACTAAAVAVWDIVDGIIKTVRARRV
jgi:hypothetical protein